MHVHTLPEPPCFSPSPALLSAPHAPSLAPDPDLRQPHEFRHRCPGCGTPLPYPTPLERVLPHIPAALPVLPYSSPAAPMGSAVRVSPPPSLGIHRRPGTQRQEVLQEPCRDASPSPSGATETTRDHNVGQSSHSSCRRWPRWEPGQEAPVTTSSSLVSPETREVSAPWQWEERWHSSECRASARGAGGDRGSTLPQETGERGHLHKDAGASPSLQENPAALVPCSVVNEQHAEPQRCHTDRRLLLPNPGSLAGTPG